MRPSAGKERVNSRGDATRLLLLITAEQLFAERGIAAVPLRDIGIAAGQKNHAVVQYHFGDRETLVSEIIAYRAHTSEERRVEMFADLMVRGQPRVSDLVRLFVFPLASHLDEDNHYLAFMSRYILENGGYSRLSVSSNTVIPSATASTVLGLLGRLLSNLSEEVLEERCMHMLTGTVHTLARYQAVLASGEKLPLPMDVLLEDLVQFFTSGLEASLGPATATANAAPDRGRAPSQLKRNTISAK
ncbi:TetR/AcrR family transcriptional regulator [Rhodococcus sp. ACPA4]|uniref:TetR family transcriptional regulator n=2 Tax=Nocardiaceae TaxID=85025 RepID=A0A652YIA3_NOCGL|nr:MULTISPECIES: TetR/AcrR family transcriptional regulator [Rhodococcus]NMD64334.1 TetR/AcrR family transcriptional regulator [Nocardia globerula]MCE4265822.1 TetR/AcrR family transcriptional regulator [Rhodococcus globerulus]MDV6270480.1 TetR/AcrR family transcriptional regulator [Rhodococcus globerulus]MDV8071104.1 TetR/AcrR family transcriptional regulator [Rhodococcus sp. IEGM 1366]NRI70036.1 TetR/AcrR family transcriptional regulator [Rhodococcus sp. MS16]